MTTDAVIPTLTVRTAGLAAVFDPGDSKAWACGGFRTAWPLGMGIVSPQSLLSFPFRGYVIFFRYQAETFEVVNVLEGHRDFLSLFTQG